MNYYGKFNIYQYYVLSIYIVYKEEKLFVQGNLWNYLINF